MAWFKKIIDRFKGKKVNKKPKYICIVKIDPQAICHINSTYDTNYSSGIWFYSTVVPVFSVTEGWKIDDPSGHCDLYRVLFLESVMSSDFPTYDMTRRPSLSGTVINMERKKA